MKAKINEKMICIPPYISTSWDHVTFMQAQNNGTGGLDLVMHLDSGAEIRIQNLDKALIDLAFAAHLKYMESHPTKPEAGPVHPAGLFQQFIGMTPEQLEGLPARFGFAQFPGLENIEMAMQHDQTQASGPDLPKELLSRVGDLTKMIVGQDLSAFPKPEPHCNCPHCQIARAIHGMEKQETPVEEAVSDADLIFQDWTIHQLSDHLYNVTNPLDKDEQYQVFLGSPVGCTCGKSHCDHIKAVLRS